MTRIRHFLLLFAALALTAATNAQTLYGDMNHNGGIDVGDVTLLIDDYLTGNTDDIPYTIENSRLWGTWYVGEEESMTFYEDNTSDGFPGAYYKFFVVDDEGVIVFYNRYDIPAYIFQVPEFSDKYMVWEDANENTYYLTKGQPVSITLSEYELDLKVGDQVQLTAYVTPEDVGTVDWSSDDNSVARVRRGLVTAYAEGTATITAEVLGVQATCIVRVTQRTYHNGHEYIDLRLPSGVKWATTNIGESSPEGYGNYYAWGETKTKSYYGWSTYKWCNGSAYTLTKYNTSSTYGTVDNKTALDRSDDVASQDWGGSWRMPTYDEIMELIDNCDWEWTTQNGVIGFEVTSRRNGSSIFLPAAGDCWESSLQAVGRKGYYWTSSRAPTEPASSYHILFDSNGPRVWDVELKMSRAAGMPVRPVCP